MSVQCKCLNRCFALCLCFRCVFLDIWWMVLYNCGRELTVGFPRRGGVWFTVQRCGHRFSFCPQGCSEVCHFISLQLSAASSCFVIWCTSSLAMLHITPSVESSPWQFHTDWFCAHLETPPLCSTALCFTKSDSGPLPFYNPIFISIKVCRSFQFIYYVLCKCHCPSSSLFILGTTFRQLQ